MLKKILTLVLMTVVVSTSGCLDSKNLNNNPVGAKRIVDESSVNNINQKHALKKYNKYFNKIKSMLEENNFEVKNLNEDLNNINFVSRLIVENNINNEISNIESLWYGLLYDENNLIKSLNLYISYDLGENYKDNNFSIKFDLIENIGDILFKFTSFNKDVNGVVNKLIDSNNNESVKLEYRTGTVEMSLKQEKIEFNIDINIKD